MECGQLKVDHHVDRYGKSHGSSDQLLCHLLCSYFPTHLNTHALYLNDSLFFLLLSIADEIKRWRCC